MLDLLYCGYLYEDDSEKCHKEVWKIIEDEYPEYALEDATDDIKGWRISVAVPDDKTKDYYKFLIWHGLHNLSLTFGLVCADGDKKGLVRGAMDELILEKETEDEE